MWLWARNRNTTTLSVWLWARNWNTTTLSVWLWARNRNTTTLCDCEQETGILPLCLCDCEQEIGILPLCLWARNWNTTTVCVTVSKKLEYYHSWSAWALFLWCQCAIAWLYIMIWNIYNLCFCFALLSSCFVRSFSQASSRFIVLMINWSHLHKFIPYFCERQGM